MINELRYGSYVASMVDRGKGKVRNRWQLCQADGPPSGIFRGNSSSRTKFQKLLRGHV